MAKDLPSVVSLSNRILSVPVALIIFNRPETTKKVLAAIARARPQKLLVIADGPRNPEEAAKCHETRAVIEQVDWPCEVLTHFSETNLGCGIRPATGLDWVFSQVEEAIILEDDCVPSPSFFFFCQELLERYRNDERVMHISGNNFLRGTHRSAYSYYFSKFTLSWGWATWRRAWQHYDYRAERWPAFRASDDFLRLCPDKIERDHWSGVFDHVHKGVKDIWDAQWLLTCWVKGGLAAIPAENLVSNIGFGPGATHTFIETYIASIPARELDELQHPPEIRRNQNADQYVFDHAYEGKRLRYERSTYFQIRRLIHDMRVKIIGQ